MDSKHKNILSTTILAGIGIGVCYVFAKYRRQLLQKVRKTLDFRNPLRNQSIHIVSTEDECRRIVEQIKV